MCLRLAEEDQATLLLELEELDHKASGKPGTTPGQASKSKKKTKGKRQSQKKFKANEAPSLMTVSMTEGVVTKEVEDSPFQESSKDMLSTLGFEPEEDEDSSQTTDEKEPILATLARVACQDAADTEVAEKKAVIDAKAHMKALADEEDQAGWVEYRKKKLSHRNEAHRNQTALPAPLPLPRAILAQPRTLHNVLSDRDNSATSVDQQKEHQPDWIQQCYIDHSLQASEKIALEQALNQNRLNSMVRPGPGQPPDSSAAALCDKACCAPSSPPAFHFGAPVIFECQDIVGSETQEQEEPLLSPCPGKPPRNCESWGGIDDDIYSQLSSSGNSTPSRPSPILNVNTRANSPSEKRGISFHQFGAWRKEELLECDRCGVGNECDAVFDSGQTLTIANRCVGPALEQPRPREPFPAELCDCTGPQHEFNCLFNSGLRKMYYGGSLFSGGRP